MSKVLLIRHAQSANNALPEELRVPDPGITELGWQQARRTAQTLADHTIRNLYCSPFLRSLETTQAIAETAQLTPIIRADIFEQGGCYSGHLPGQKKGEPGMGAKELQRRFPGWSVDARIGDSGWWGQEYESEQQAKQRAGNVLNWIESDVVTSCDSLDVMVIHADFKYHLLEAILGSRFMELNAQVAPLYNTSMTLLDRTASSWRIVSLNSVLHLPASMLSD